jgi:hypothetical protein
MTKTTHPNLATPSRPLRSRLFGPVMVHPTFCPASRRSGPRAATFGPRSEDVQPNESVNRHPPTVSPARSRRERGPNSITQLVTSGSKRYAPLPLECRKTHPNHTVARSAWAIKEQEALRRLGLRVSRTFIRFVRSLCLIRSSPLVVILAGRMEWLSTGAFIG